MSELVTLNRQPDVIITDLSSSNAATLELLLANKAIVDATHEQADRVCPVYNFGHPALQACVDRTYSPDQAGAVDHGIKVYEALMSFVGQPPERCDTFRVTLHAAKLGVKLDPDGIRDYGIAAVDDARSHVPRLIEVVSITSARFLGPLTHYAILGAAIARQFEIDTTDISSEYR